MEIINGKTETYLSKPFVVPPGEGRLISAYGFPKMKVTTTANGKNRTKWVYPGIVIQKTRCEDISAVQVDELCGLFVPAAVTLQSEDVTQCGLWTMNACQNTGVITLPGVYKLSIDPRIVLGDLYVTIDRIDPRGMRYIPHQLIFGNTN